MSEPAAMEAARLTAKLGFIVTAEQVERDRAEHPPMYVYCKRCKRHVLTRKFAQHAKEKH
jgi:hypothetical protein